MAPADFPWPARIGRNWRSSPRMRPAETHPPRRDEADVRCLGQSPIPSRTSHPECARVEVLPRSTARTKSAETTYIDILERSQFQGLGKPLPLKSEKQVPSPVPRLSSRYYRV